MARVTAKKRSLFSPQRQGMGSRSGQAAITDALFMLTIISGLTAFLFLFTSTYGRGLADQTGRNSSFEFVASALKTIMYQSAPRDPGATLNLSDPNQEVDYIMAMVKEDFADDGNLTSNTKRILSRVVFDVMRPVADSHDFLFSINTAQKYVFVMLWYTDFDIQMDPLTGKPVRFQDIKGTLQAHKMLFCNPALTGNAIQKLKLRVGNSVEVQSLVNMVEFQGNALLLSTGPQEVRAGVNLSTWVANKIPDAELTALNCIPVNVDFYAPLISP